MITVIYAHPHPLRSRGGRPLLDAVRTLPGVAVRSLYDLYPDFAIDVEAEQRALAASRLVVWQHPLYWYSVPALLKLWFEGARARLGLRRGRHRAPRQATACGSRPPAADPTATRPRGCTRTRSSEFVPPVRQTARFCGMNWLGADRGARRAPRRSGRAGDGGTQTTASGSNATSPRRAVPRARPRDERVLRHRRDDLSRRPRWSACRSPRASASARCSAIWSPAALIGPFGLGLVRDVESDPALRRVRRGADAVRDRARARSEAARQDAPAGVRRRRAADSRCAARCSPPGSPPRGSAGRPRSSRGWRSRSRRPRSRCRRWPSATCSPRRSAARRSPCCCSRTSRRSR